MSKAFPAIITNALAKGIIPVDLPGKEQLLGLCNEGERQCALVRAMVIAKARHDNFPDKTHEHSQAWLAWVGERWSYHPKRLYAVKKVGDMLTESIGKVTRVLLFETPIGKLEEIAQLWEGKPDHLDAWLKRVDINALTRDELRAKIHAYLGKGDGDDEKPTGGKQQPAGTPRQLDFFEALYKVATMDDAEALAITDTLPPKTAMRAATRLMDVTFYHISQEEDWTPEDFAEWRPTLEAILNTFSGLEQQAQHAATDRE